MATTEKIAIICVGNRLMLDDGAGPAVYDDLHENYRFPDNVSLIDAGCMTMDLLPVVKEYDYLVTVDAVDGTGEEPGTVFRFAPEDIAGHGVMQSLHDMRLIDLLNAAALLGFDARGMCFGVQVENMNPAVVTEGLTPRVYDALPLLRDAVLAHLIELGVAFLNADGTPFVPPTGKAPRVEPAPVSCGGSDEIELAASAAPVADACGSTSAAGCSSSGREE
ncbi:hydrogenase maturation protease [uncultured Slackia sp.]|uniref:hydrogenase maturation protease n=1 Tax=uncultured Slackia sp. TaxID=665903 RepID=UPI0025E684CB|nr:hydrogenase maturation protease [uncultured Slackia sp.]